MSQIKSDGSVFVAIRIRPQNESDLAENCCTITEVLERRSVQIRNSEYRFDRAYDMEAEQNEIFEDIGKPMIEKFLFGFNTSVFAYGQTGSGKTYTMGTSFQGSEIDKSVGLIPRTLSHLFEKIKLIEDKGFKVEVSVRFIELYNEEIFDLLDRNKMNKPIKIHETSHGVIKVTGVSDHFVSNPNEVLAKLAEGTSARITASTNMNLQSSRSHAIFTIFINQSGNDGLNDIKKSAKFHLVDLAGSERLSRTGAIGDRAKEAISINSGLLALGNVINSLGERSKRASHIPYRDSKLTRLLQDSLGGNSYTVMIACISPSDRDMSETISTLNYAIRAKNIKNKISINKEILSKRNTKFLQELEILRQQLVEKSQLLEFYIKKCELLEKGMGSEIPNVELPPILPIKIQESRSSIASDSSKKQLIDKIVDEEIIIDTEDSEYEIDTSTDSESYSKSQTNTDLMNEQYLEINKNIDLNENLFKELEDRQRKYEEMKDHYEHKIESLQWKIEELIQKEADEVENCKISNLSNENVETVQKKYKDQINTLQDELKLVKVQQLSYQKKIIDKDQVDKQLENVKSELLILKQTRVNLTKSLHREIANAQKKELDHFRKIRAFERDVSKKEIKIKNLLTEKERSTNFFKRKIDELKAEKRNPKLSVQLKKLPKPSIGSSENSKYQSSKDNSKNILSRDPSLNYQYQPFCLIDSPAISGDTKNKWKSIEDQITNIKSNKVTLMLMNQQIEKNIQERSDISHELAELKKKLENCPVRSAKPTSNKILKLEEKLEVVQKSIESNQKNVAEIEINDTSETAIELFKTCRRGEDFYIFRHVYDSLLRTIDELVLKEIKLKEAEIEGKLPRKRQAKKTQENEIPPQILTEEKSDSFKRRKTALPREIKDSFVGTPYAIKEMENIEPITRRVTRNMKKASSESQKNILSDEENESKEENLSNETRRDNKNSKKKLLNLERDLYNIS